MNIISSLLSYDSYLVVNKPLLRLLKGDVYASLMLSELITLSNAFRDSKQMKDHDNWFFRSVEDVEKDICMNDYHQRAAITSLESLGLIETKRAGRPAQRYFKINEKMIKALLLKDDGDVEEIVETEKAKKKTSKIEFYYQLNSSISKGFEEFKGAIDNIKKPFAAFMYTWSKLFKKFSGRDWIWTPERFGKLNHWFKTLGEYRYLDYAVLFLFFGGCIYDDDKEDLLIPYWIKYYRSTPDRLPELRQLNPSVYWN